MRFFKIVVTLLLVIVVLVSATSLSQQVSAAQRNNAMLSNAINKMKQKSKTQTTASPDDDDDDSPLSFKLAAPTTKNPPTTTKAPTTKAPPTTTKAPPTTTKAVPTTKPASTTTTPAPTTTTPAPTTTTPAPTTTTPAPTTTQAVITYGPDGIPDSFDYTVQWPQCSVPVQDQGNCGSCFVFGPVVSMTARTCIATNGTFPAKDILSPQFIVDCLGGNTCNGGLPGNSYKKLKTGTPVSSCNAYRSGNDGYAHKCDQQCDNGVSQTLFHAADYYSLKFTNLTKTNEMMQRDIMTYGPITSCFSIHSDFEPWFFGNGDQRRGVYVKGNNTSFLGSHCVVINGWGVLNGVPFWMCQNQWGTRFGENGYFRMLRGSNNAMIENTVLAGIPVTGTAVVSDGDDDDDVETEIVAELGTPDFGAPVPTEVTDEVKSLAKFGTQQMIAQGHEDAPDNDKDHVVVGVTSHVKNGVEFNMHVKTTKKGATHHVRLIVHRHYGGKRTLKYSRKIQ